MDERRPPLRSSLNPLPTGRATHALENGEIVRKYVNRNTISMETTTALKMGFTISTRQNCVIYVPLGRQCILEVRTSDHL